MVYLPNIYHKNQLNVGKYTIHGPYGIQHLYVVLFLNTKHVPRSHSDFLDIFWPNAAQIICHVFCVRNFQSKIWKSSQQPSKASGLLASSIGAEQTIYWSNPWNMTIAGSLFLQIRFEFCPIKMVAGLLPPSHPGMGSTVKSPINLSSQFASICSGLQREGCGAASRGAKYRWRGWNCESAHLGGRKWNFHFLPSQWLPTWRLSCMFEVFIYIHSRWEVIFEPLICLLDVLEEMCWDPRIFRVLTWTDCVFSIQSGWCLTDHFFHIIQS